MNNKATLVTVIALTIGLGGVAAVSWVRGQQTMNRSLRDFDRVKEADDHGQTSHLEHDHDEREHTGDDLDKHGNRGAFEEHEHDEALEEAVIQLSDQEREALGIKLATATPGRLIMQIGLPGEIVLNADRLAHIVPRAPGVVREVLKSVGDTVRAGEVMAWLESTELGEAKVDYLARRAELGCCTIDLTRTREVHDNTMQLLEFLDLLPSLEALREINGGAMGEYRSDLVSAYAEFVFARGAYQRERSLFEKKVASESEYQAAEAAYKKADALYTATRDSIQFKIRRDLLEAERAKQLREMELKGAERRLYVLGLTSEDLKTLELLAQRGTGTVTKTAKCNDPNCKGCAGHATKGDDLASADLDVIEEKLAWHPLRAPFDATVIDKHLTLGEKHGDDSNAFTIADLSSVWVDINVYQKDLPHVRKGAAVRISAGKGMTGAEGVISFVAPTVDEKTRTALARVILPNPQGTWRPGLFVSVELSIGEESTSVVVPKKAVQRIGEERVVFVDANEVLKPVRVSLGRGDRARVEVLSGLMPNERYVVEGAFELKARIVTSGLGTHAGHGH